MKILRGSVLGAIIMLSTTIAHAAPKPFALVELFVSEGCSSCPPADDLLKSMVSQARQQGIRIFPLSFQVDYWNNLGWVDPFSSGQFTERQQDYSNTLYTGVYTPEMIVNGKTAFVGSDASKAQDVIRQALSQIPTNDLELKVSLTTKTIEVDYRCDHHQANSVVNVALVERGLESQVTAGENAGRLLHHDNVVRIFKTVDLEGNQGHLSLPKLAGVRLDQSSIIGFIQVKKGLAISAANIVDLK